MKSLSKFRSNLFVTLLLFVSNLLSKSRSAVIGCHNEAYHKIGIYADLNKQAYCKKHNYDLFLYHKSLDPSRHPAWSKILAVEKHIGDYKWLLWIDSDALIMNSNIKIESLIDQNTILLFHRALDANATLGYF